MTVEALLPYAGSQSPKTMVYNTEENFHNTILCNLYSMRAKHILKIVENSTM